MKERPTAELGLAEHVAETWDLGLDTGPSTQPVLTAGMLVLSDSDSSLTTAS